MRLLFLLLPLVVTAQVQLNLPASLDGDNRACMAWFAPDCDHVSLLLNGKHAENTTEPRRPRETQSSCWQLTTATARGHVDVSLVCDGNVATQQALLFPTVLCAPSTFDVEHDARQQTSLVQLSWATDDVESTSHLHQWVVRNGQVGYQMEQHAARWYDPIDWRVERDDNVTYVVIDTAYASCKQQRFVVARPPPMPSSSMWWWWWWPSVPLGATGVLLWWLTFTGHGRLPWLMPMTALVASRQDWPMFISAVAFVSWFVLVACFVLRRRVNRFPRSHEWKWLQLRVLLQLFCIGIVAMVENLL